jgi:hypothetical protein
VGRVEHRGERRRHRLGRGKQQRDGVPLPAEREASPGGGEDVTFIRGSGVGRDLRVAPRLARLLAHFGEHLSGRPREVISFCGIVPDGQPGQRGAWRGRGGGAADGG